MRIKKGNTKNPRNEACDACGPIRNQSMWTSGNVMLQLTRVSAPAGPAFVLTSRSCPCWCPKHLIWMYHVAAARLTPSLTCFWPFAPRLLTFTKTTKHLLSVWNRAHAAHESPGGSWRGLCGWWVSGQQQLWEKQGSAHGAYFTHVQRRAVVKVKNELLN